MEKSMPSPLFCLADVVPGDCVAVTGLAFDSLRFLYPGRGFAPGDQLRCIGLTGHSVFFESALGGTVSLDRFYACFITVRRTQGWHRRLRSH
jgi:hypothetical protein